MKGDGRIRIKKKAVTHETPITVYSRVLSYPSLSSSMRVCWPTFVNSVSPKKSARTTALSCRQTYL